MKNDKIMCLAIPGKVIKVVNPDDLIRQAIVDFGGISKEICIAWVDAAEGDYILAHAGMAISVIDKEEAQKTVEALNLVDQSNLNLS